MRACRGRDVDAGAACRSCRDRRDGRCGYGCGRSGRVCCLLTSPVCPAGSAGRCGNDAWWRVVNGRGVAAAALAVVGGVAAGRAFQVWAEQMAGPGPRFSDDTAREGPVAGLVRELGTGWLVVTTDGCVRCGPVVAALRGRSRHRVVEVDAAAVDVDALGVRSAPTVFAVVDGLIVDAAAGLPNAVVFGSVESSVAVPGCRFVGSLDR